MADYQTICPFCNDSILIPEEFFNSDVECPSCHKQFFIPKVTEEETVVETEGNDSRTFNCPMCGAQNTAQENFFGKLICKGCKKEIEIINEDFIPCPHCGNTIFKKDSTCIYCQRAINEAPKKKKKNSTIPSKEAESLHNFKNVSEMSSAFDTEERLEDSSEDDAFVIKTMERSKLISLCVLCFFICIASGMLVVSVYTQDLVIGIVALLLVLVAFMTYLTYKFAICYRLGIYKNLVRIRIAAEKMTDLKK